MNMSLATFLSIRTGCIAAHRAKFCQNMAGSTLNWEKVKIRYLEMDPIDKRSLYKCGSNFKTISNVPTWEEYARAKSPLPEKNKMNERYTINPTKNAELRKKVSIFMGDIVSLEVDAIVNAANSSLMGGGGVDGAIHAAAGGELKEECRTLSGCKTGEAKITCGYKLPAKYVIHTVGPKVVDPDLLAACYRNSLDLAVQGHLRTIAFPCISTGVYGYPNEKAAHVALKQVRMFLERHSSQIDRVIFCLFLPMDLHIYESALQCYFPIG